MNSLNGQASKQTLTEALRALQARGVGEHVFADFRAIDPEVILDTCLWFDEERKKRDIRVGVLVEELRGGGRKPARRQSVVGKQREYGERIVDWLREHFPELSKPEGNRTHPAAITEVIHLHYRHGKSWGPPSRAAAARIRQAVADFDREMSA